jgi:hypothetical protein
MKPNLDVLNTLLLALLHGLLGNHHDFGPKILISCSYYPDGVSFFIKGIFEDVLLLKISGGKILLVRNLPAKTTACEVEGTYPIIDNFIEAVYWLWKERPEDTPVHHKFIEQYLVKHEMIEIITKPVYIFKKEEREKLERKKEK